MWRKQFQAKLERLEDRLLLVGNLAQVDFFDTWNGVIPSTDVAGITYHEPSGHLFLADSEINETPQFLGPNIFEVSLAGDIVHGSVASNNTEPTGITFNEFDSYFYVTNDNTRLITRYDISLDTPLEIVDTRHALSSADDPEGITSDPATGMLYVADGNGGGLQILAYDSDLDFQYSFPLSEMRNAEGIAFDPRDNHLLVLSDTDDAIFEYTLNGVFLAEYDISNFSPVPNTPQGLGFGPNALSLYMADAMVDNSPDGRVYEATYTGTVVTQNSAPLVSAGQDRTVHGGSLQTPLVEDLDAAVADEGLINPIVSTTWSQVSGPATATFGDASAIDTTASLPAVGTYVLRLTANDGEFTVFDDVSIEVQGGNAVDIRVASSTDDAEEKASGSMRLTSSDLELVFDGSNQTVGTRFIGVGIPQGASISAAYIQFQTDKTNSVATSLTIEGEAVDDAVTFSSANGNIFSRPRTAASVAWSPAPWTAVGDAGPDQRTPDITSIIQELVNRPGWASGNSLAVIISGTGERTAESYNGSQTAAPLLHVEFDIVPANPPVAVNDADTTAEDTPVTTSVLVNDNLGDPPTTITRVTQGTSGAVVDNGNGTITYTPSTNFNGSDSYTYTITDNDGETSSATVDITVTAVNDTPLAANDADTTAEDSPVTTSVLVNDDLGDEPTTITSVTQGTSGGVVDNGNGTITYTPDPNFNGSDSYTYTITDNDGETSTATVDITVTAVNDTPLATNDADTTAEDTPVTTSVLVNDDLGDEPTTITNVTQGASGGAVDNGNGTVTYTPNPNFNGSDSYTYTITDNDGETSTATVNITVTAANQITLVRHFDTWDGGIIRSTDVAGIAYYPPTEHLYLADSEINEISSIFNGDNIFVTNLLGNANVEEIQSNNSEPTGITYNEFDQFFYVSNDNKKTITRYDSSFNSPLAVVKTTDDLPSATDPEGITSNPANGRLYVADGTGGGDQILTYDANLNFLSSFSVGAQVGDPEGIAFNPNNNHLYIVSSPDLAIFEYTLAGSFVRQYDISDFTPTPDNPQGLTFGPTSATNDDPATLAIYIADAMVDNQPHGRVYEAVFGSANSPPVVDAGPDKNVSDSLPANATLDGTVSDDGLPGGPPTTTWIQVSRPSTVSFADASAVDTTATFPADSSYVLRLEADDGQLVRSDEVTISTNIGVVNVRINANTDDAEERPNGSLLINSNDLELVLDGSGNQTVGLRFNGINIPQGATISDAYVQFQVDETPSDPTSLTIDGHDTDNAPTFSNSNGNISNRPRTSASVPWNPPPWPDKGVAGPDQRTSNIASVIQEIVNRPGWSSGNSLVLIISGTGERVAESFNGDQNGAPLLHVEFPLGAPLMAESSAPPQQPAQPLANEQLSPIVDEAIERLGDTSEAMSALSTVTFDIVDLPGSLLGQASSNTVQIDRDAAGFGWFVDTTPADDREFSLARSADELIATPDSPAYDRFDLLSAVMHELGHLLGYDHSHSGDVMDATLSTGTRRLLGQTDSLADELAAGRTSKSQGPNVDVLDELFASWELS